MLNKLTSIICAGIRKKLTDVTIPRSNNNIIISRILRDHGFISGIELSANKIKIFLKFYENRPVLKEVRTISRNGRKVYCSARALHFSLTKLSKKSNFEDFSGLFFIQTSVGILTHKEAIRRNLGGEVLLVAYS